MVVSRTIMAVVAVLAFGAAVAVAEGGEKVTEIPLPGSTGGVRTTTVSPDGGWAFFTNDTGTVFKVDTETLKVEGMGNIDLDPYGIVYYAFLSLAYPSFPYLYLSTRNSYLIKINTDTMELAGALDLSAHILPGWGGGYTTVVQRDTAWLTGNYSVVQVALGNMEYISTVPLKTGTQKYEPLCGDISVYGKNLYFGSAVGNRTSGLGGLSTVLLESTPPRQFFAPLGPKLHWPFQVVGGAHDNYVYIFASAGVGVFDIDLNKVVSFTPSETPLHELMCHNGRKSIAVVSATTGGWQVWKLDNGKATLIQQLGQATTTTQLSCGLYAPANYAYLGGQNAAGAAVVTRAVYNPFA